MPRLAGGDVRLLAGIGGEVVELRALGRLVPFHRVLGARHGWTARGRVDQLPTARADAELVILAWTDGERRALLEFLKTL